MFKYSCNGHSIDLRGLTDFLKLEFNQQVSAGHISYIIIKA